MKRFTQMAFPALIGVLSLFAARSEGQSVLLHPLNPAAGEFPEAVGISRDGGTVYAGMVGSNRLQGFNSVTLDKVSDFSIPAPTGIVADAQGNVFCTTAPWFRNLLVGGGARPQDQGVWRVTSSGEASVFGVLPFENTLPNALAVDRAGNIYASNLIGNEIYRIDAGGHTSVWAQNALFAGNPSTDPASPSPGFSLGGNGMQLRGNRLFVDVTDYGRILEIPINPDGTAGSVNIYRQSARLVGIDGFDLDNEGNVYGANLLTSEILKVDPQGNVTVLASKADGISSPTGITLDSPEHPTSLYFSNFSLPAFPFLTETNHPAVGKITLSTAVPEPSSLVLALGLALSGGTLLYRSPRKRQ